MRREYSRKEAKNPSGIPFITWLRSRCACLAEEAGRDASELWAFSNGPSKRASSFQSMTSFDSHYRVDLEESTRQHVTFDSGVAELWAITSGVNAS